MCDTKSVPVGSRQCVVLQIYVNVSVFKCEILDQLNNANTYIDYLDTINKFTIYFISKDLVN